jgi:hypothetical protein
MGLLDIDQLTTDPQNAGLLSLGLRLMSTPGKTNVAIGQAGLGALQDINSVRNQNALRATNALRQRMEEMQIEQAQREMERRQGISAAFSNAYTPATPDQQGNNPSSFMPGSAGGFDQQKIIDQLARVDPMTAYQMSQKAGPTQQVLAPGSSLVETGPNGVRPLFTAPAKPEKPDAAPNSVREYQFAQLNGYKGSYEQWIKASKNDPQPPSPFYAPVQTADGIYAFNGRTGTVAPVIQNGKQIVGVPADPKLAGAMTTAKEEAEAGVKSAVDRKAVVKKADQFLSVAKQAENLLGKGPTGSGIGAAVDAAGRAFGYSPNSAQVAGQLEGVSGWLVANVPRMEGPQSNFDVANYQTMAGKVGDRTVPIPERKAALKEVMRLQEKYKELNQDSPNTAAMPAAGSSAVDAALQKYLK